MNFGFCNKCFTLVLLQLKEVLNEAETSCLNECTTRVIKENPLPHYTPGYGNESHLSQIFFLHLVSCHLPSPPRDYTDSEGDTQPLWASTM